MRRIAIFFFFVLYGMTAKSFGANQLIDLSKGDGAAPQKISQDLKPALQSFQQSPGAILDENADDVDQDQWIDEKNKIVGAVFECKPYCRYLSFLAAPTFIFELPDKVEKEDLRFLNRDSAAFKALFSNAEVQKAETESAALQKGMRREIQKQKTGYKDKKKDDSFLWTQYRLDYLWAQPNFTSNSNLQTDLASGAFHKYKLTLELVPNWKMRLAKIPFYNWLDVSMEMNQGRVGAVTGQSIGGSALDIRYYLLHPRGKARFGAGFWSHRHTEDFAEPSVEGYSSTYNMSAWTLRFDYDRATLEYGRSLSVQVSDSQGYRASPYTGDWQSVRARYCSPRWSVWSWLFSVCGGAEYWSLEQTSGAASNLNLPNGVSMKESQTVFSLGISGWNDLAEKLK